MHSEFAPVLLSLSFISGESVYSTGCWIGLRDRYGTGLFQWIETGSMDDISFRDWRRTEFLNRDLTAGHLDNGKRCVYTYPWQSDPLISEQGTFLSLIARRASEIKVEPLVPVTSIIGRIDLSDGCILQIGGAGSVVSRGSAFVGESTVSGLQSLVVLTDAVLYTLESSAAVISARLEIRSGNVTLVQSSQLVLSQVLFLL